MTGPWRGARIFVDQFMIHGVHTLFCVLGESNIEVLDAIDDAYRGAGATGNRGGGVR